ncbi:hypothetical protein RND81_13G072300 [Saponaria officinalis]|uniref:YMGG-like Gly-zipper domain-containing protein n=1 Tax=Saponaria officinalis TaxID=3572 RepID=A0AAW1GX21_SAPOF
MLLDERPYIATTTSATCTPPAARRPPLTAPLAAHRSPPAAHRPPRSPLPCSPPTARRPPLAILGNLFSAFFTFCFALVGTLLGAMTGALIGQETESGFVRGAAIGAISGAVFSIEVFKSSLVLWRFDESDIGCLLYLIDVIASLLSGRLVRERIGPAMLSAVQSQMGAVETNFEEVTNIFDTGGARGLSYDFVDKIPKIKISPKNNTDASGDKVSCSVCLQVSKNLATEIPSQIPPPWCGCYEATMGSELEELRVGDGKGRS